MKTLQNFGWSDNDQRAWDQMGLLSARPARVIADFGTSLKIAAPQIMVAELSGKLAHYTRGEETPKVGDWVAVTISGNDNITIESVVVRRNEIARKVAGKKIQKQIIATNIDLAFVLLSLDENFSVERLRRFLYQLSINMIKPIIVLNKADKTDDVESYVAQLQTLNLPIILSTATDGSGIDYIAEQITPGLTAILLGSSGVGKSTITNKLLGRDTQKTKAIRESDSTGMHTTVHREIFMLPSGGMLIDTPGIRELQLWGTDEDLDTNYDDIIELTRKCKYTTCQHGAEEGCAVVRALADGSLDKKQYASYIKMKFELSNLTTKKVQKSKQDNKRHQKHISNKAARNYDIFNEDA